MTKTQISALLENNKKKRTRTLKRIRSILSEIIEERNLTKKMYFWTPNGSASGRRYNETRRNISLETVLGELAVYYSRDYSESCRYVYATDYLTGEMDGETFSLTLADLKKIIAGIDGILERRES